jgi:hypothetical protein
MLKILLKTTSLFIVTLLSFQSQTWAGGPGNVTIHLAPEAIVRDPNLGPVGTAIDMGDTATKNLVSAVAKVGYSARLQEAALGGDSVEQAKASVRAMVDFISENHINADQDMTQAIRNAGGTVSFFRDEVTLVSNAGQWAGKQIALCMESCAVLAKAAELDGLPSRLMMVDPGSADGVLHVVVDFPKYKMIANANWGIDGVVTYTESAAQGAPGEIVGLFTQQQVRAGQLFWQQLPGTADPAAQIASRLTAPVKVADGMVLAADYTGAADGIIPGVVKNVAIGLSEGLVAGLASESLKWLLGYGIAQDAAHLQAMNAVADRNCMSNPSCAVASLVGDGAAVASYDIFGTLPAMYTGGVDINIPVPGSNPPVAMHGLISTNLPNIGTDMFFIKFDNGQVYVVKDGGKVIMGTTTDGDVFYGVKKPGTDTYLIRYSRGGTFATFDPVNGWKAADTSFVPLDAPRPPITTGGGDGNLPANLNIYYTLPQNSRWSNDWYGASNDDQKITSCWVDTTNHYHCF